MVPSIYTSSNNHTQCLNRKPYDSQYLMLSFEEICVKHGEKDWFVYYSQRWRYNCCIIVCLLILQKKGHVIWMDGWMDCISPGVVRYRVPLVIIQLWLCYYLNWYFWGGIYDYLLTSFSLGLPIRSILIMVRKTSEEGDDWSQTTVEVLLMADLLGWLNLDLQAIVFNRPRIS